MANTYLIVPLTKSPHEGRGIHRRIGRREPQDWVVGCRIAYDFFTKHPSSKILILSGVHVSGEISEASLYVQEFVRLGTFSIAQSLAVVRKYHERIEQIDWIKRALRADEELCVVMISTWLDYPRTRWLCRDVPKERIVHRIAFGVPRPWEAITDIILIVALPMIDILGQRKRFVSWVRRRRLSGKH